MWCARHAWADVFGGCSIWLQRPIVISIRTSCMYDELCKDLWESWTTWAKTTKILKTSLHVSTFPSYVGRRNYDTAFYTAPVKAWTSPRSPPSPLEVPKHAQTTIGHEVTTETYLSWPSTNAVRCLTIIPRCYICLASRIHGIQAARVFASESGLCRPYHNLHLSWPLMTAGITMKS